jgi:hypothetical protein
MQFGRSNDARHPVCSSIAFFTLLPLAENLTSRIIRALPLSRRGSGWRRRQRCLQPPAWSDASENFDAFIVFGSFPVREAQRRISLKNDSVFWSQIGFSVHL